MENCTSDTWKNILLGFIYIIGYFINNTAAMMINQKYSRETDTVGKYIDKVLISILVLMYPLVTPFIVFALFCDFLAQKLK